MTSIRRFRLLPALAIAVVLSACSPGRTPGQSVPASPPGSMPAPALASTSAAVVGASELSVVLGRPTDGSITASVMAATDRQVEIAYGTAPGKYDHTTDPSSLTANLPANIEITGLAPDTAYYYAVVTGGMPSAEHTFHTQRSVGTSFTFTIDADPHFGDPNFSGPLYATTLANAASENPDFHIDLGDTFMTEKARARSYDQAAATFSGMRPYLGIIGASAPLFLVNGNHEGEVGWTTGGSDTSLPLWCVKARQQFYPNPTPNSFYSGATSPAPATGALRDGYYAWTWGDALFIVLDPFWYTTVKPSNNITDDNWRWTLGRAQYDWLRSTLESSKSRYKFVFTHHLVGGAAEARGGVEFAGLYEWGGHDADGTYAFDGQRPGWGKPIHQLLVDNHVTAVFHGHDHVYVEQDLDGIVYQELPQPSMAQYNRTSLAAEFGYTHGVVYGSSGHLRVTVTPAQVTVDYVRAYLPADEKTDQLNAQIDYTYSIAPR